MEEVKILIVEDDYTVATYLKELLIDIGYTIANIFSTGEEAIAYVNKHDVDMILMDIELEGEIDGIETVKKIQQIKPCFIIYITSLNDKKTFIRAKSTFPDFFLSKPFNKFQLLDIINEIITNDNSINTVSFYNDYFFVKSNEVYKKYPINSIKYIQASGSYVDIFLKENKHSKVTLSKNMKSLLNRLKTNFLCRINRSYTINIHEIESIDNWHVKLYNIKESIVVQDSYRPAFEKLIRKL